MVRLKEICKVDWGNTNLTKAAYTEGGEYLGVSATGCDGKFNYYDFEAYTPVISAIGANCGKMFLPQRKFVAIKNTITLVPHDCIDGKYLYYAMINNRIPKRGGGQPFISKSDTENYEIPCPSLSIQREIVQIFDILSSIIKSRQQQLQKLDELVKARFVEMFGDVIRNSKSWEICVLADIASSRLGKMLDTKQQTGECSYPYLANFNVQWFRFNTENLNQMDFNEEDRIEFELQNGDLLVCEGGEIGRCAVWHNEIQPCFFQKALHRVRCNRQIVHPDYLGWWFKYNCDHDGFATIAGAKATIAHLPGVKLKQLRVAIPPLELQEQFAAFVNQTDKSKAVIQKALDETKLLFDSLMQEYFG